ncbi:MAG: slr1658 superfamily regulator [Solirubrobacterales bacterium]
MSDVVGEFVETGGDVLEGLELTFSPTSIPLKQRWRNNGLSADFLADYVSTFLPRDESDPQAVARLEEVRGAIKYIANELLENGMKYSEDAFSQPICMKLVLGADSIVFYESNAMGLERGKVFRAFVAELLDSDPMEMYVRQLERSAETGASGLGLLTMINDYGARLGWKFDDLGNGGVRVTTQVRIDI